MNSYYYTEFAVALQAKAVGKFTELDVLILVSSPMKWELFMQLPTLWNTLLQPDERRFAELSDKVEAAYAAEEVYPPREQLFAALEATPPEAVRCVILGQDPYHEPGQAHGLSFSVAPGTPLPRSLRNIYQELSEDLGVAAPAEGCLLPWARQGVLLLNSVLSVQAHQAGSHGKLGWQWLTDGLIASLSELPQPIAFILWGNWARSKATLTASPYPRLVLESAHPSPLSARRGFFGSRPFSAVNAFLRANGEKPIDWASL